MGDIADMMLDQAFLQMSAAPFDECGEDGTFEPDPLYYHMKIEYEGIIQKSKKAVCLQIKGEGIWLPKSICREWTGDTVYVHRPIFKQIIQQLQRNRK